MQNRRLGRVLGACGVLVLGVLVAAACGPQGESVTGSGEGQATLPAGQQAGTEASASSGGNARYSTLEVETLVLLDRLGREAGRLETHPIRGTLLTLNDQKGNEGIFLQAADVETRLMMRAGGKLRFDIDATTDAAIAGLRIRDMDEYPLIDARTEGGATTLFLNGPPNDKGVRPNIGLMMPPDGRFPMLSVRNSDLERRVWTLEEE